MFLHIFVCTAVLIFIAIVAAIGLFYYVFAIPEPEGLSLASWPYTFTDNFSLWMENEKDNIKIEDIGIERLDEYGLWIQVVDENGQEVFAHNKPENYPASYSASELIALSTSAYKEGNTVFVNSFEDSGRIWNYLVGFPYPVGKYVLYYNGENVGRLSPVFWKMISCALFLVIFSVLGYSFWRTRHLGRITKAIGDISLRSYKPLRETGMFGGIYGELNKMDREIRHSDEVRKDTERARQEWIANITHDMKTPLSPVKGYAELLADGAVPESETVQEYGKIMVRNINYAEGLMNDLKLTYQLDSGAMPFKPRQVKLIRYLRELIIDIVNTPALGASNIELESSEGEITVCLDADLFRRAVGNIIINALTHNPPQTKVTVTVRMDLQEGVSIVIRDNGRGLNDAEQRELFNRYYRGANTKEKPEGSGLGLAIAKQIIVLHDGDITVKSKPEEGTQFTIFLPFNQ